MNSLRFNGAVAISAFVVLAALAGCQPKFTDAELLARATGFEQQGDRAAAIIELKNALQQNPGYGEARALLGQIYLHQGNVQDAESELSRALELGISDPTTQLDHYQSLVELLRHREVLDQLDLNNYVDPTSQSRAYAIMADALVGMERHEKAEEFYEQSLAIKDNVDARIGLVYAALRAGQILEASALVDEALQMYPTSFKLNLAGARAEIQARNYDEALRHISRALEIRNDDRANLVKAELLLARGDVELAEVEVDAVLQRNPSSALAEFVKGKIRYQDKDYQAAKNLLEHVVAAIPDHAPSLLLLGYIYEQEGLLEQARRHLRQYLNITSESLEGTKLFARVLIKLRKYNDAEKAIQPLLAVHSEDTQLLELAAAAMIRQGKVEPVVAIYQKLVELAPQSASAKNYLGSTLYAQGKVEEGVAVLEQAVAKDAGQVQARTILMRRYLETEEFGKAEKLATAVRDVDPEQTIGWNYLGLISLRQGDVKGAKAYYERALALDAYDPDANGQLAYIARGEAAFDKAQAYYDQVYKKQPEHFATRLANAGLNVQRQDNNAAIAQLEIATKANPADLHANILLATYYIRYGQYREGLRQITALRRYHPKNTDLLPVLTEALLRLGYWAQALEVLSDWDKQQPSSALVAALRAHAYTATGRRDEAKRQLETARKLDSDNLRAILEQVRLAIALDEYTDAAKLLNEIQDKFPENRDVLARAGDLAFARGDWAEAVAAYRQSTGLGSDSETVGALGKALFKAGQRDETIVTWQAWLKTFPNDRAVRYLLAQLYRVEGDHQAANGELSTILQRDKDNPLVLNELAWHLKDSDRPRAKAYAERAHDRLPDNAQIKDTLAVILMGEQRFDQSVALLAEAVKLAPTDPEIKFHLVQALVGSGAAQEARLLLQDLLATSPAFPEAATARALLAEWQSADR